MCSTTRGPAIWPSLVTWPTISSAEPLALAKRISAWAEPRTWLTVPGADSIASLHMVWIESITTNFGGSPDPSVATMSSTSVWAASWTGALGEAEAGGAQTHLGGRFLARHVDDARSRSGDRGAGLDEQRRLADARLAADQGRRARHEAAAGHPVEFADPGDDARLGLRDAAEVLERERRGRPRRARAGAPPTPSAAASSMIVFHSPQDSHFPCQRCVIAPQFWQT